MKNNINRALTYSLLAHIRGNGKLVGGTIQIFIPLIKRVLSRINEEGIYNGQIIEIKNKADELYSIDFPIPVLRRILGIIAKEVNSDDNNKVFLNQDDSFLIKSYTFTDFEDTIRKHKTEIDNIEKLFKNFCETCGDNKPKESSIIEFIEKNKFSLSKYLSHKKVENGKNYVVEAQFVEYFKQIPPVYEMIRKIYLGSILTAYIEYKTDNVKTGIELLFDTNFILGLIDLNTKESAHTCRKIVEITRNQGYKLSVLKDTIKEAVSLLKAKSENFELTFLQKSIYPEDIYNACERRNLNKADLERIADNLEIELNKYGISVIFETTKWRNAAKFSKEFEMLKNFRTNENAALHDATVIYYVRDKRQKRIKDFENVNCWFINNPINREKYNETTTEQENYEAQPEMIKADDFLNIIWLSNPSVESNIDINEIADIGLSSLVSIGLTDSLPKASIIHELDENIQKYAANNEVSDIDIIRIATRITTRQLTEIDNLNRLAKENKEKFVKRLTDEAQKQKELEENRIKKIELVLDEFVQKAESLNKIKLDLEGKSKQIDDKIQELSFESSEKDKKIDTLTNQLLEEKNIRKKEENLRRTEKREDFIDSTVEKWQKRANYELFFCGLFVLVSIICLLWSSKWDLNQAITLYGQLKANLIISSISSFGGLIFTSFILKKWYDRNHNYSNIENFKKNIKIPVELLEKK